MDGRATFGGILDNCIHLDYTLSQFGRGLNACASPQLMVKGRILNFDQKSGAHVMGPSNMLQLAADRKDMNGISVSGADAKYLEMSGTGIEIGMGNWIEKIKQWTQEIMAVSRKDPETVSGAMSGKAMELIDEEFLDLVAVQQTNYGEYGMLEVAKMMARMLVKGNHPKFAGITEAQIDDCQLEYPKVYTASPAEVQMLIDAVLEACVNGLKDPEEGAQYLDSQIGWNTGTGQKKPIVLKTTETGGSRDPRGKTKAPDNAGPKK
jgi:hypothetical protein